MSESTSKKRPDSRPWKKLSTAALLGTGLLAICLFILFRVILNTHLANDYVSHTLSRHLEHKVTISGITMSGATIYLNGITIESPPEFKSRKLLSARTVSLTPDMAGLLRGRRSLSHLTIIGLGFAAEKNSVGRWNFSNLLQRLTKKKAEPSSEIFVRRFSLQDASVQIDAHKLEKVDLTLADFSTKGTTNSKLELSGKDASGNPLRLTAAGHFGSDPSLHVTAEAPAVSLAPLQRLLASGSPPFLDLQNAQGKLLLSAEFRNRLLTIKTTAAFKNLMTHLHGSSQPISGTFEFGVQYNSLSDNAELYQAIFTIDNLVTVRARGSVQRCRTDRVFTLLLSPDKADLNALSSLLPEQNRQKFALSGALSSRGIELSGNRSKGITNASGDLSLRKITVTRAKQLVMAGGTADFSLKKTADDWQIDGRVFTTGTNDAPLVESLSIPFTARFSPRFKPTRVTSPSIRATLAGIPLRGSFLYQEKAPVPFTLSCAAANVPLRKLNGFLSQQLSTIRLASGEVTATARLSGTSPKKFAGRVALDLSSAEGTSAKSKISLEKTAVISTIQKSGGIFSVNGVLNASGGDFDGKPFSAKTGFTLGGGNISLESLLLTFATTRIKARQVAGKLPTTANSQGKGRIPLMATLSGAEVSNGDLAASGITGTVSAQYDTANPELRLTGTSDISIASLAYQNQHMVAATAHLTATGKNAQIDIKGKSLDGTFSAKITTEFFSTTEATSFSALFLQQKLMHIGSLLPNKSAPRISAGSADARLSGTYNKKSGIEGELSLTGQDISFKGSTGKTLASGISATFIATLRDQTLNVQKGLLNHAEGPSFRIAGTVERFASADRTGNLHFSLPSTTINSLLDVLANALPRNLQEATCDGSCTLAGSVELRGANTRVNGKLSLAVASLEIPSQKISVSGIEGNFPFSLEFPWQGAEPTHPAIGYSRDNYSRILKNLGKTTGSGDRITISSVRFGALEAGPLSLFVTATNGITTFSPIEMNLYDGKLLGSAYLILKNTPEYATDILLTDVSLKQFCDSFPSIKGYITGRVDGILSLKNDKGGLEKLTGFVNLWTRAGKGEEMLVSKDFLQKLAGKKLQGFFFQNDRPYDNSEISAYLLKNYLTFEKLDISHTNFLGMKDLNVSVAPVQNRIALDHLLQSIRDAAARGKGAAPGDAPAQADLKWLE